MNLEQGKSMTKTLESREETFAPSVLVLSRSQHSCGLSPAHRREGKNCPIPGRENLLLKVFE